MIDEIEPQTFETVEELSQYFGVPVPAASICLIVLFDPARLDVRSIEGSAVKNFPENVWYPVRNLNPPVRVFVVPR